MARFPAGGFAPRKTPSPGRPRPSWLRGRTIWAHRRHLLATELGPLLRRWDPIILPHPKAGLKSEVVILPMSPVAQRFRPARAPADMQPPQPIGDTANKIRGGGHGWTPHWSYFVSGSASAASGTQTNEIEGSCPCCLLLGMKAVSPASYNLLEWPSFLCPSPPESSLRGPVRSCRVKTPTAAWVSLSSRFTPLYECVSD